MELLRRYELADFFEKMCLFLQHRDMRDAFQDIEFKNSAANGKSLSSFEIIKHQGNSFSSKPLFVQTGGSNDKRETV